MIAKELRNDDMFKELTAMHSAGVAFAPGGIYQGAPDRCDVPNPYTGGCTCPVGYEASEVARSEKTNFGGLFGQTTFLSVWMCVNQSGSGT